MNNQAIDNETLFDKVENYTKTSIDLLKLKSIEKSSQMMSTTITSLVVVFIATMFILLFNIGMALVIGQYLNKNYLGFFIVAGFYLIVLITFYIFKNTVFNKWLQNALISKFLKSINLKEIIE